MKNLGRFALVSEAHCTTSGTWRRASSRNIKRNPRRSHPRPADSWRERLSSKSQRRPKKRLFVSRSRMLPQNTSCWGRRKTRNVTLSGAESRSRSPLTTPSPCASFPYSCALQSSKTRKLKTRIQKRFATGYRDH
ncbi:hypothetical protein E2C01_008018 [Portunus trituberculatus]|uniref:Uncharacterized protein n=1 Tax=Portunus trituberculatus TaxID=210409 RepID=A0A5B7D530_PORTR|nr:hypothetical protein [Portunus trituberculatus]